MSDHTITVYVRVPDPDEGLLDLITDEVAEVVFKHDPTAILAVEARPDLIINMDEENES